MGLSLCLEEGAHDNDAGSSCRQDLSVLKKYCLMVRISMEERDCRPSHQHIFFPPPSIKQQRFPFFLHSFNHLCLNSLFLIEKVILISFHPQNLCVFKSFFFHLFASTLMFMLQVTFCLSAL